jgi:outer membrane protein insertion porin family
MAVLMFTACRHRAPRAPGDLAADTVLDVRVTGVHAFKSGTLRDGLDTLDAARNHDIFSPRQVELDEQRLRTFYYQHGFFGVDVASTLDRRRDGIVITFQVREGRRAVIDEVELVGLPPELKPVDVLEDIDLQRGDDFEYETYELAKKLLETRIKHAGYAHVQVDGTVAGSGERGSAFIHFEIVPGPLVHFGPVSVTGVDGPLRESVLNRIEVKEGAQFDPDDITDTQSALYDLGRFSAVRVEYPDEGAPPVVPVKISVVMSSRHEWRLGGGFGADAAEYQFRLRAGYSVLGWPTPLTNTRVEVRPRLSLLRDADSSVKPGAEASVSLERLDLFYPKVRGEVRVSYELDNFELYTGDGPRLRLGADSPIGRRIHVAAGWQLRGLFFRSVSDLLDEQTKKDLGFLDPYRLGFYEQSISLDGRDDIVNPMLGGYGELRVEEGGTAALGRFHYVKVTPEVRGYLGRRWAVLAARVRVGAVIGDLPVTQRYFAGGASSQRGFPERRLAPTVTKDGDDVTIGGGALIETSLELRVPIGTLWGLQFGGAAFMDGGDVTEKFEQLDLSNLYWAPGGGLRVGTPIGPVRFDVGYRVNRHGATDVRPDDYFAFHLSLGQAF